MNLNQTLQPRFLLLGLTLTVQTAWAQTVTPQQVEISGRQTAIAERKEESRAIAVISNDELLRHGDQQLSGALQRIPGITVNEQKGRGVEIRLRGMGQGYTQILVNGSAMPQGYNLDNLNPDLVERIEVLRVASADQSSQAIAGTINIVLKKKVVQASDQLKFNLNLQQGLASPQINLSLGRKLSALDYALNLSAEQQNNRLTQSFDDDYPAPATALPDATRHTRFLQDGRSKRSVLTLNPRLNWKLDSDNQFSWQSLASLAHQFNLRRETEQSDLPLSEFPTNSSDWTAHTNSWRNEWQWDRRLSEAAKFNLNLSHNYWQRDTEFQFRGRDTQQVLREYRYVEADADEREWRLKSNLLWSLNEQHNLKFGADWSRTQRWEYRFESRQAQNYPTPTLSWRYFDTGLQKYALFAQDEWSPNESWAHYLGVRWESLRSNSTESGVLSSESQSQQLSPSWQSVYKINPQQQWRWGLARSFKAPTAMQLITRPLVVDNNNSPLNPDRSGNPNLQAERAWGLDLAFEQYLGTQAEAGNFSASVYLKKIDEVVLYTLSQRGKTWLSQPQNYGQAISAGIELEAKLNLAQLLASKPPAQIRFNLNKNWSKLKQITGSDNNLPNQTPFSANLGLDYQFKAGKFSLDFAYEQGLHTREDQFMWYQTSPKRWLDLSWQSQLTAQLTFKLAVSNLLAQTRWENEVYRAPNANYQRFEQQAQPRSWRMQFEQRF